MKGGWLAVPTPALSGPFKIERLPGGRTRILDPDIPDDKGVEGATQVEALDNAKARREKKEKEKERTASLQPEQNASGSKKPRKMRVDKWMLRDNVKKWQVVEKEGYEAAAERIAAIKAKAPTLKNDYGFRDNYPIEEYGFEKPFDLADNLIGLLHDYRCNEITAPSKEALDAHEGRMEEIRKSGSLANATEFERVALFFGGYGLHRDPIKGREKHMLQKAVCKAMRGGRKPGRYLTLKAMLARGLASTYYLGTGKLPSTGGPHDLRGPYVRFARECLMLLGIQVTGSTIRDQALIKRKYFENRHTKNTRNR